VSAPAAAALPPLAINPALDPAALAERFARERRIRIDDFLAADAAAALHANLRARGDWVQVVSGADERAYELDRAARAALSASQAAALDEAVYAGARRGFQFRFETVRVPDDAAARAASDDPLAAFAAFLSGGEARAFLRTVTGAGDIAFADAQATAYAPGDFLTAHDDAVAGKNRRAAYVYGLTPGWRADWGGLLLFHDSGDDVSQGFTPRFNSLSLFAVPQPHSVSLVSRAAPYRRYSITGWLRAGA
jgi:SM-20-related protein